MAGFLDLLGRANPALAVVHSRATEGRDWRWPFTAVDDEDEPVDLSDITGECTVWDSPGGDMVTTMNVSGTVDGDLIVTNPSSETAGLAGDGDVSRPCRWGLVIEQGGDSLQVWGPADSTLVIDHEEGH